MLAHSAASFLGNELQSVCLGRGFGEIAAQLSMEFWVRHFMNQLVLRRTAVDFEVRDVALVAVVGRVAGDGLTA
jgi:hypothetical protein